MPDLRGTGAVARPVVARMVRRVGEGASIRLRAGQDVVTSRQRVANAVDEVALFGQCEFLRQIAPTARFVQGIAVYFGLDDGPAEPPVQVVRNPFLHAVPRAFADAVPCVDGRLAGTGLRTEIGTPRSVARANGGRQPLAPSVGPCQTPNAAPL